MLHRAVPRRSRALQLPPLDFWLGPGLHALVGAPSDGTLAIARLVGGIEPPAQGEVVIDGGAPSQRPDLRRRIGVTLETPLLPPAKRVGDLLRRVDSLRGAGNTSSAGSAGNTSGAGSAFQALEEFGLGHWRDRRSTELSFADWRAVELLIALSTHDPIALAFTEPGADTSPIDRQKLRAALALHADRGACVMVMTASMGDAVELCRTIHVLERGNIARWVPADEAGALSPGRSVALRVEVDLPRLLVATLADDPAVVGIDWDQQDHRSTITVRGDDLDRLAIAVARASGSAGASVRSIAPIAPGLDEVRAAASGLALAAYHAAYRSYAPPIAETPSPPEDARWTGPSRPGGPT
jgi:ABC-type multidrug transport system ATPase subunit